MRFDGSFPGFRVVFSDKNDTVNTEAKPLGKLKVMASGVRLGVLNYNLFHGREIKSGRAFRPGEDEIAG